MKSLTDNRKPDIFINKANFILMGAGLSLIITGFVLMYNRTENPEQFSADIFGYQQITLAPVIAIAGYILQFFAIMYHKKAK
jgi:hypothetical protein